MGLVHIYCGDGKGKTSAAIGLAVRMTGRGKRVTIARFLKTDDSGEVMALSALPRIRVFPCEKEFGFVFAMDEETKREAAEYNTELFRKAVAEAIEMCKGAGNGTHGQNSDICLLVLDEMMAAVNYNMVPEDEVVEFLKHRPENLEIVLTGRNPSERIAAEADYITEMRMSRHPYEKGISARIGIEY